MNKRYRRRNAIGGQFAARKIEMLESRAYRVLTRSAHQVLSRIEIEHARHGGVENGELPVTYDHFVEYGVHRRMIAPAIRELVALGFVEVTQRGGGGNADLRRPSLYRLTHRPAKGEYGDGTHEWRKVETTNMAGELAKGARQNADPHAVAVGKKRKSSYTKCRVSVLQSATEPDIIPAARSGTTSPVQKV